jgi:hypothetical protein
MKKAHTVSEGKQGGRQFATVIFWVGVALAVLCVLSTVAMILLEAIHQLKH